MDPYDAILEQLKRAQVRGLETVTNRLDFVIESLDELIQEAKSSVKEALPQEAEELFPIAEVSAAVTGLREAQGGGSQRETELAAEVAQLRKRIESEPTLAGAELPPPAGISLQVLRRLDQPRSQSELLRELLPVLAEHVGRAAVLVIRGTGVSAWSGIGFAAAERLREWQDEVSVSENLQRFADTGRPVRFSPGDDPVLSKWLAEDTMGSDAYLFPVCLRGKLMGAIYVDRVDGRPWNPEVAQGLVALACWLIDTLHYRETVPSPTLEEAVDLRGEEVEVASQPATEAPATVAQDASPPAEPAPAAEPGPAQFDPSATVRVDMPPPPAPPAPEPQPRPAGEPAGEVATTGPPPVQPVAPPPEIAVEEPKVTLTPEDEARHEEARRFARRLVSEIKLYNEEEVERGRANKDLYHRLKEDIDRSREMFEKRIPQEVRNSRDYFYDELLRILGDGDPDALGM